MLLKTDSINMEYNKNKYGVQQKNWKGTLPMNKVTLLLQNVGKCECAC